MAGRAVSAVLVLMALSVAAAWVDRPVVAVAADSVPEATDVRLGGSEADSRFIMDLTRKIDLHAFTLADPYRVVVDIPQVTFKLPPQVGQNGRGLIKAFRFGLMMEGGSRIVLDVTKPVRVATAFVMDAADGDPARLVLDLVPTDRQSFLHEIAVENRLLAAQPAPQPQPQAKSVDPRPLVVLDPGHGGIDTGTVASSGQMEKDIVLDVAKRLRARIEQSGKFRVLMTRSDDTYIPLDDRVRIARNAGAALFVSIHADSLPHKEGDAQGATVYTLSNKASDDQAAELADKENGADVIAGVDLKSEPNDVAGILIDLAQRETKTFSMQFAHDVVSDMKGVARLHKEPIKSAGFRVLRAPDVPSVLVELGYVSNHEDLRSLMSDTWRDRTADSIAKAIDTYLSTHGAGVDADANQGSAVQNGLSLNKKPSDHSP
jgi:N-acetylmuramoyl-L-alanine amidase